MKIKFNDFQHGKFVDYAEITDKTDECPICLNRNKRRKIVSIQKNPDIDLLFCDRCKGLSASFMPTTEMLDEYYSHYYDDNPLMVTFHNIHRFAEHIIRYMPDNITKHSKVRIMDFGGGDGSMSIKIAEKLTEKNESLMFDITLVDYIKEDMLKERPQNIKLNVANELNMLEEKFLIVLASGVFEHIPELNTTINKIFSLIEKGGFFYARTPFNSPFKRIFKNFDMTFPAHVHDLGASFWNRFPDTFQIDADIIASKPAIVETSFSANIITAMLSYCFKFPAYLEQFFIKNKKDLLWNFYGGWEFFLKIKR